jgi:N-dimethylarginine dimethylaminohydrolase
VVELKEMRSLLLCPPDYYGIEYEINPWMDRTRNADSELARAQWRGLLEKLQSLGCEVELVAPRKNLPDMVFTANAGLLVGKKFIRSNFRFPQRQGEEEYFEKWFANRGYEIVRLPVPAGQATKVRAGRANEKMFFEGEGDALFCGDTLFCGYRFRSDIRSHQMIGELLKTLVISVELVKDRFYHLDTCFCPLPDGSAIWHPEAFDEYGQRAIRSHIGNGIEVVADEAARFACNAIVLEKQIVLPEGCPKLCAALGERGYETHPLPMTEFLKAGGACKCLVMLLPQRKGG